MPTPAKKSNSVKPREKASAASGKKTSSSQPVAVSAKSAAPAKPAVAPPKTRTAHVVSHTHWDREWRYPIWETRLMLLDFMDELIDVLETGKYPSFLLDGQVSPILDYLEIRPERTERVKALVESGQLLIGPWFTLPDEFPVDGEALVRNLVWGRRKSEALGRVFNAGYTPFGWGQTAQLPQLYAGFGMDVALIGKRVAHHRAPFCEFLWRAPDGTELVATRFGDWGRQNFYFNVHLSALFGFPYTGEKWVYDWANGGQAYHRADPEQMEQDHFLLNAPDRWFPESLTPEWMEKAWHSMHESLLPDDRLMMNGCDYTASQPLFPEMMERMQALDAGSDRQWIHTSMETYVDIMRRKLDRKKLPVVEGELRDGPAGSVTGNALTTRLYLKRLNKQAQNLLIRYAEPMSVVASLTGAAYPKPLIQKAWEFLLSSHPHDSINGVTQDKTVRDVASRLDQVVDISQSLGNRAMQELMRRIDRREFAEKDVLLVVFNPLPYPRRDVVEAWVNLPDTETASRNWPPPSCTLQIRDAKGNAVGTQWQGATREMYSVAELHARAVPFHCQRHRIFFDTGDVPAGGYKVFRVDDADESEPKDAPWSDFQSRTATILSSPTVLDNGILRVEMNPNGTFNLTNIKNDWSFRNLNSYEDRGELGDYWVNRRPMFDQVHSSIGCAARIWAEESGPLQATLVSEIKMSIPAEGNLDRFHRGEHATDLTIRTAVTLRAGAEEVEVTVSFENRQKHHYLRAIFPSGVEKATHSDAGGHLCVDRRPIRPQGPAEGTVWPDMGTLPHNAFVDVSDGRRGLAFLNDSITEFEVLDNAERTVALSLVRSVRNWVCTEHRVGSTFPSQDGGQALGPHKIRYALRPHAGDWQAANIPLAAEKFNIATRIVQARRHKGELPAGEASLYELDNSQLRVSALKKAEDRDSVVLRVYNPTGKRQRGTIRLAAPARKAWLTNLNEERQGKLEPTKSGAVAVDVAPGKIVTVEMEM